MGREHLDVRPLPRGAVSRAGHAAAIVSRAGRWCRVGVVLATFLVGVPTPVLAQLLSIGDLEGQLMFGLSFENEELSQSQQDRRLERLYLEERLGVRGRGALLNPDFARFSLGVDLGLFQDHVSAEDRSDSTSRSGDGLLTGYDLRLSLLGATPYGLDVFGHRSESNTRRDFAGEVRLDVDSFGANWRMQSIPFPSYLSFQQQEVQQRFTLLPTALQQDETRRIASYFGERRGDTTTLTADYRFDDVSDRARLRGAFRVHSAGLLHMWRLGEYRDHHLGSNLRVFRREGQASNTTLLERESLHLRHSRSLSSDYAYSFSFLDDSSGGRRTTHGGLTTVRHQLYDSLSSSGSLNTTYSDLSPGRDLAYGGNVGLAYRKEISWGAALLAGVGYGYQVDDRVVPAGTLTVADEPQTFSSVDTITLENPDVLASTIVVVDQAGTTVFVEGIDYVIEPLGRRTQLRRAVFGGIAPGQTVLVSYNSEVGGPLRVGSRPLSFNAGLDFNWLHLFYTGTRFRQDVLRGNPSDVLGSIDSDSAGFETRWRSAVGELRLLNEYVTYDAVDVRYSAVTLTQSALANLHRSVTLAVTGIEGFFDFTMPQRNRTFLSERGTIGWRPVPGLVVDGFVGFRSQRETGVARDQVFEFGTRSRWTIGAFSLSLAYNHAVQDIGSNQRTGDLVRFDVVRRF